MKVLPLTDTTKETINLLYHCLLIGRQYRTPEARTVNRIKRAFEEHAIVTREESEGRNGIRFKAQPQSDGDKIVLEDAEFELLKEVFMGVSTWPGTLTEDVEKAEIFLTEMVRDAKPSI